MRQLAAGITCCIALFAILPSAGASLIAVNRETGNLAWYNFTGELLDIAAYTLRSGRGGFAAENWLSIAENYDADSGGLLDEDDNWFVLGSGTTDLSEATLGTTSLENGTSLHLGPVWTPGSVEDARFEYLDAHLNELRTGSVLFYSSLSGDYDADGTVDQGDLNLVLLNWGAAADPPPDWWINDPPLDRIDQEELNAVLLNWGDQATAPTLPAASLAVARIPEPASLELLYSLVVALWIAPALRPCAGL